VGNEQFSFRAPPEEHGVTDCYHQVDEGEEGTFTKVGVVKRKIFVTQKLREEDRKRVKTATETHEKERLSHKYVAPSSDWHLAAQELVGLQAQRLSLHQGLMRDEVEM
jgi:hypothetical protein